MPLAGHNYSPGFDLEFLNAIEVWWDDWPANYDFEELEDIDIWFQAVQYACARALPSRESGFFKTSRRAALMQDWQARRR